MVDLIKISVVVPAYRARKYLPFALASIAKQHLSPLEILIVDDHSPEPVDDIVSKFKLQAPSISTILIRHEENTGLGAARNTGIAAANGDFVAFLDHDDIWKPEHLKCLGDCLSDNNADLAFCSVNMFSDDTRNFTVWGPRDYSAINNLPFELYKSCFITPSGVVARRDALVSAGGFSTDKSIHMCEDLDLWLRLLKDRKTFAYSENASVYYRKHSESATGTPAYMARESARVRSIHCHWIPGSRRSVKRILSKYYWDAATATCLARRSDAILSLGEALLIGASTPIESIAGFLSWSKALIKSTFFQQ